MDTWESHFCAKSRRRSRRGRSREAAVKGGVLLLLFACIAVVVYMHAAGWPL